jgi:hypothetical protein
MPSVSKKQQRLMGMVHAVHKGEEPASPEVAELASRMKPKDAEKFAKTKHKGLPEKKKKKEEKNEHLSFEDWLKERDPNLQEVSTTTADVALFLRRAIPQAVHRNKEKLPLLALGYHNADELDRFLTGKPKE